MSVIRFGRGREYQFFRREVVRSRWDLAAAVHRLHGLRRDAAAISLFRGKDGTLGQATAGRTVERVNQSVTRVLVAGRVLIALRQREGKKGALNLREPAPVMAPVQHSAERAALQAAQR